MKSELKLKDMNKVVFIESISTLQDMKRPELIKIAKDMGHHNYYPLRKSEIIELINNPPQPPPTPSEDELKEIKCMMLPELRKKAKEMGLQRYSRLNKKQLVELIKNPTVHQACIRKRKVTITCNESGEKFTFPAINQAAKFFKINPGKIGIKLKVKTEKCKNSIVINGKRYQLQIE